MTGFWGGYCWRNGIPEVGEYWDGFEYSGGGARDVDTGEFGSGGNIEGFDEIFSFSSCILSYSFYISAIVSLNSNIKRNINAIFHVCSLKLPPSH